MNSSDVVAAVAAPMGDAGASFYFHPDTLAKGKEIGLDGFRFYFLGRGGMIGDVSSSVVHGAFGYFSRPLVDKIWNSAKERVSVEKAVSSYLQCCAQLGNERLSDIEGLDEYCVAASQVIEAADPSALSLFAGAAAAPVPDELGAKALHQTMVLRELRGSIHLLAIVAQGLEPAVAHAIRRPNDVETFGYGVSPEVTEDHRTKLASADLITNKLMERPYGVLDAQAAQTMAEVATRIDEATRPS